MCLAVTAVAPRSARAALGAIALLGSLAAPVAFAPVSRWGVHDVDSVTYLVMIHGVAHTGLPAAALGAPARWLVPHRGRAWGKYTPLYPYLAAGAYRVGGVPWVLRAQIAALWCFALGVFSLGRRVAANDRRAGALAVALALTAGLAWKRALLLSPYPLGLAWMAWCLDAAARAVTDDDPRRANAHALRAGGLAGAAVATHLLAFGPALAVCAALAARRPALGGRCLAAIAPWLAALAAFNAYRFGSPNPISYGPCVWAVCVGPGQSQESMSHMLAAAWPALAWAAALTAMTVVAWRRRGAVATVAVSLLGASALTVAAVRAPAVALARCAWVYLVDAAAAPAWTSLSRVHLLKSAVQASPWLALAALARPDAPVARVLVWPCAAAVLVCALRGTLPSADSLGFSVSVMRYLSPALPAVAVLAAHGWRRAGVSPRALAATLAASVALAVVCDGDEAARAAWLLWLPWLLAASVLGAAALDVAMRREATRVALAACAAWAVAHGATVGLGVDLVAERRDLRDADALLTALSERTPPRAGFVGASSDAFDAARALGVGGDRVFLDVTELRDCGAVRETVARWHREARAVYGVDVAALRCLPSGWRASRRAWPATGSVRVWQWTAEGLE